MSTGDRNQFDPQDPRNQYRAYQFVMDPDGLEGTQGPRVRSAKDIILDSSEEEAGEVPDQDLPSSEAESSSGSSSDEESSEEIFNPLAKTPPPFTPMLQQQLYRAPVEDEYEYAQEHDSLLRTYISPGGPF